MRCPFLAGRLSDLEPGDHYLWDAASLCLSMDLRCKAAGFENGHWSVKPNRSAAYVARFVLRHRLEIVTPWKIARLDSMSVEEAQRRILATLNDFTRTVRLLLLGGGRVFRATGDETSVQMEPAQSSKVISGGISSGMQMPSKGSLRSVSAMIWVHEEQGIEGFKMPILLNLGEKATRLWEKEALAAHYGVPIVDWSKGALNIGDDYCFAFMGSSRGTTHLGSDLFWKYLCEIRKRWMKFRKERNDYLIMIMDGAPGHSTEFVVNSAGVDVRTLPGPVRGPCESAVDWLKRGGVELVRLRSRLTSFICANDAEIHFPLKREMAKSWRYGLMSLLSVHAKEALDIIQLKYGCPSFFYRYGFENSGSPADYLLLASRLQRFIPEDLYEWSTSDIMLAQVPQSFRQVSRLEAGLTPRIRSNSVPDGSGNWQRPQVLRGYNADRQGRLYRQMYGVSLPPRARSTGALADLDVENF